MKIFLIFLIIFTTIYTLVNVYIGSHILMILPQSGKIKALVIFAISFLALSFIFGRIAERFCSIPLNYFLIWIGSIWMGLMTYLFTTFALSDFTTLIVSLISKNNSLTIYKNFSLNSILIFVSIALSVCFCVYGYINAKQTKVTKLTIKIEKSGGNLQNLKIAVASDIHLGHMMNNSHLKEIVDKINSLNPDIILLPGDILDEDITPVVNKNMGDVLQKLSAKIGVYAVTGNHEYIGGVEKGVAYLEKNNIDFLRDESQLIDNSFYVVGREDRSLSRFRSKKKRESLEELLVGLDKTKPIILMDHQPYNLEETERNGIDLQLSGHTHNGQLFPFNYITKALFEKSWGYLKKGNTHVYVSCGVGTWGPPMKTSSISEIVEINIKFKEDFNTKAQGTQ